MTKNSFVNIGKFVRKHREEKGLSQTDLSFKLGYKNGQFVSNIERAKCSVPLFKAPKLCEVLGVEKTDLLLALYSDLRDEVYAQFATEENQSAIQEAN